MSPARRDRAPGSLQQQRVTRPVSLVTVNAAFAARLGEAFRGSREIALQIAPVPGATTSVDRLACDCSARTLIVDDALFTSGRIVPHVGPVIPARNFQLLIAFRRIESDAVALSLQTQAHGCIDFDIAPEQLVHAVDAIGRGEFWFPRWMMATFYDIASSRAPAAAQRGAESGAGSDDELSQRELEVMGLVRRGLTNKEIARELCISPNTVKKHVHSALHKLGVAHRRQLF